MERNQFDQLVFIWIILACAIFLVLLKIPAPYGRHSSQKVGNHHLKPDGVGFHGTSGLVAIFVFCFFRKRRKECRYLDYRYTLLPALY